MQSKTKSAETNSAAKPASHKSNAPASKPQPLDTQHLRHVGGGTYRSPKGTW